MNGTQVRSLRQMRQPLERQPPAKAGTARVYLPDMQRKRAQRAARRRQQLAAVAILWLVEVILASLAGALVAVLVLPLFWKARGYPAFGGECFIVLGTTLAAYHIIHAAVFKRLES